jgi:hypothetical protein
VTEKLRIINTKSARLEIKTELGSKTEKSEQQATLLPPSLFK